GASPSSKVMTLTYQDHSLRERSGLGKKKHINPKTQESSKENVSRPVTVSNPEPIISSVPTKVKTNDQEFKMNELTKLDTIVSFMSEEVFLLNPLRSSESSIRDKPCSACEKGNHKRASFKTKQNFSIRKYLPLLHMDLFGPVSPMSINHEKYTIVIVDEYSRMVENQNDVNVKQIRTNNGTKFGNSELESFCDERGISNNISSPYTLEQNGVAERKNSH
ncbi:retrovirus-related pol polyprotein from transposon TNT 1-94, partial [Tanacetum coccineum]